MRVQLLLVLSLVLYQGVCAWDQDMQTKVDDFITQILSCRDIVGINLAIVKDQQTLYTQGYGYSDLDTEAPVTDTTLFGVASLSKAFATTLHGQVLRDNGLSWDTPVKDILGDNFYFSDLVRTNMTTSRDLAAHITGMGSNNNARFQRLTREQLAQKIRFFSTTRELRERYSYNNLMYGLLSHVTETIEGKPWEDLVREKIYEPLNMDMSDFIHQANLSSDAVATPYILDGEDWVPVDQQVNRAWGEIGGSGGVLTNAKDMAKWLHLQLNEGRSEEGTRVITGSVIRTAHSPRIPTADSSANYIYKRPTIPVTYDFVRYGLGWRVGSYRDLRMVLHTGSLWGYGALLTLLPDVNIGIYTSVSGPDDGYIGRRLIHMYIMDLLLGEGPWLNLTTACTFPQPWASGNKQQSSPQEPEVNLGAPSTDKTKQTTQNIEDYVGQFGNFGYGNVSVSVTGGVGLQLDYGSFRWSLSQTGTDEYFGEGIEELEGLYDISSVSFGRDDSGGVNQVTLSIDTTMPVFVRGLKFSDAPLPPSPPVCEPATDPPTPDVPGNPTDPSFPENHAPSIQASGSILLSSVTLIAFKNLS